MNFSRKLKQLRELGEVVAVKHKAYRATSHYGNFASLATAWDAYNAQAKEVLGCFEPGESKGECPGYGGNFHRWSSSFADGICPHCALFCGALSPEEEKARQTAPDIAPTADKAIMGVVRFLEGASRDDLLAAIADRKGFSLVSPLADQQIFKKVKKTSFGTSRGKIEIEVLPEGEFHGTRRHVAIQPQTCEECGGLIVEGEEFEIHIGRYEGEAYRYNLHDLCSAVRKVAFMMNLLNEREDAPLGDLKTYLDNCGQVFIYDYKTGDEDGKKVGITEDASKFYEFAPGTYFGIVPKGWLAQKKSASN